MDDRLTILCGDALEKLRELPDESVQCCVTSPPYWGLRDYGTARWEGGDAGCEHEGDQRYYTEQTAAVSSSDAFSKAGEGNAERLKKGRWRNNGTCVKCGAVKIDPQVGLEKTPEDYVAKLVAVFEAVRRVLRGDGTLWINLGDSYCANGKGGRDKELRSRGKTMPRGSSRWGGGNNPVPGLKCKDLVGIPWLAAFALRSSGWYLRSDIVWAKRNCMPESVADRPTRSHEYIFLFSKQSRYFYDNEAIKEPCIYDVDGTGTAVRKARAAGNKLLPTDKVNGIRPGGFKDATKMHGKHGDKQSGHGRCHVGFNGRWDEAEVSGEKVGMRNKRDVWIVAPAIYPEAHFATYPPDLIKPCILAGSRTGDTILDPFGGSGTTGQVALELGRKAILIELNPEYVKLIERRCSTTLGFAF